MSNGDMRLLASKVVAGLILSEDLSKAAADALGVGCDSPALRVLAGLTEGEADESKALFDRVLDELSVPKPTKREAVLHLARETAKGITIGDVAPYEGAKQIWELSLILPEEHFAEFDPFVYAASEWEDRLEDRRVFEDGIVAAARGLMSQQQGNL